MAVRAKFKLDSYETVLQAQSRQRADGSWEQLEPREMRSLRLSPVYSTDPNHENKKFWDATPTGGIVIGTVNPEAWKQFRIGKEYYIDFTPAD